MNESKRLTIVNKILQKLAGERVVINGVTAPLAILSGDYARRKAQETQRDRSGYNLQLIDGIPSAQFVEAHAQRLCNIRPGHWTHLGEILARKPSAKLIKKVENLRNVARDIIGDNGDIPPELTIGFTPQIVLALKTASETEVLEAWAQNPAKAGRKLDWPACCVACTFAEIYPLLASRSVGVNADDGFVATLSELFLALGFAAKTSAQHYARYATDNPINRM